MSPELITGLIQGSALLLLAMVLWHISKKIDAMLKMTEAIVMKLLDLIKISTDDNATRTQEQMDSNTDNPRNQ